LEVETRAEPRERAPTRLIESLPIPHHGFQAISEQGADGPSFFGGYYARFSNQIGVEFKGDVGLLCVSSHVVHVQHHYTCHHNSVSSAKLRCPQLTFEPGVEVHGTQPTLF
jgi:hypothetical protein